MINTDMYTSLSELIRKFLELKTNYHKEYKDKIFEVYNKICNLKTKNEKEEKLKKNTIIFIKNTIEKEFKATIINNLNNTKNDLCNHPKANYYDKMNEELINDYLPYNFKKIEENNFHKEINELQIDNINNSLSGPNRAIIEQKINNNSIINVIINNNQIIKNENNIKIQNKENQFSKKDKIEKDIDELLSQKIHIIIIKKIKEICKSKNKNFIDETKILINNIFNKLKTINEGMKNIKVKAILFAKYFTLLFSVYPFFSKKQKELISKLNYPKDLKNKSNYNQLLVNQFNFNEVGNNISNFFDDFLFSYSDDTSNNKIKEKLGLIVRDIFKISPENYSLLYYAYQILILFKILLNEYNIFYKSRKLLTFKIKFILSNYKIFSFNDEEFGIIYKTLFFIRYFYLTIYKDEIMEPFLIKFKHNILKYGDYNHAFNDKDVIIINYLFDKRDNEIYDKILNLKNGIIPHFYNIREKNIKDLIDYSSFYLKSKKDDFLDNIISLIYIKSNFIRKNFNKYKSNLINLEKEIFNIGKKNLCENKDCRIINKYSQKPEYKKIFNSFSEDLNKILDYKYKGKYRGTYELYPMGSLTQFLSLGESDIDIYLYIKDSNKKVDILNCLYTCLQIFCINVKKIISTRLCVINLVYKGINMDISSLGYPPYLHSLLFREYCLIEPRLPMIGITLKYLKDILGFNNKQLFLNSYCWMSLLIIFLQDIINPPILPKVYSDTTINDIIYQDIEYGNNIKKIKHEYNDKENFMVFFSNTKRNIVPIPDCLFNKKKFAKIYKKTIAPNINKLSCAEILLKFLEFITFYFKYDTIFAQCSIEKEGFYNMKEIKTININDGKFDYEMNKYNNEFRNYFSNKYLKFKDFSNNKRIRDGFFLIRDPVDSNYNPGQSFKTEKNLDDFINQLRFCYSVLIRFGSFEILKEKIKAKNKNENILDISI